METLGIQAVISLLGELRAQGQEAQAERLLQQSMDAFGKLDLPKFTQVVAQELGPSALAGLRPDAQAVGAQRDTLGAYDDIINGGGMASADEAAVAGIGNVLARRNSMMNAGIQQGFEAAGRGDSGAATAAHLVQNQNAAQNLNEAGLNQTNTALNRRMGAIGARGQFASGLREQDMAEKTRAAQAADEIARYGANARTQAAMANNANAAATFNAGLARAGGQAGAAGNMAGLYQGEAQGSRTLFGNLGAAGGKAAHAATTPRRKPYDPAEEWDNPYGGGW